MLTGWYTYRIASYKFAAKVMRGKRFEHLLQQEEIRASLKKNMENPLKVVEQMLKEIGNYAKDIRDLIIEALVALALMILVFPVSDRRGCVGGERWGSLWLWAMLEPELIGAIPSY